VVHSVELLFDPDTESAIRDVWQALTDVGLRSPAPTSRPHATMVVAEGIADDVDGSLSPVTSRLPFPSVVGAPMLFGRSAFVLVRLVVPSAELLALQAEVFALCAPHLTPGPMANCLPGQWTPHITLARRVDPSQLKRALAIRRLGREIEGAVVGLRRWDGDKKAEYVIS
jgi:2'-5' RNA ligase superfamily